MINKEIKPMTTDEKISNLLFILTHLSQYIKYYDEEEIKWYIDLHGYERYSIQQYVLDKSPIVNKKYNRKLFEEFFFNGVNEANPFFKLRKNQVPIHVQIEEVNRDISVIKQEIEILYIFKNWELDKNVISINISDDIINSSHMHMDSVYLANVTFPTTMFIRNDEISCNEEQQFMFDNVIKFKEDNDSQLLSCGYTLTDEDQSSIHVFFIYTSKERYKNVKEIPFMILGYDLRIEKGVSVSTLIRDKFGITMKKKYDTFKESYLKLSEFLFTVICLSKGDTFSITEDEKIKNIYKRNTDIYTMKNNYKEVYQGILQSLPLHQTTVTPYNDQLLVYASTHKRSIESLKEMSKDLLDYGGEELKWNS